MCTELPWYKILYRWGSMDREREIRWVGSAYADLLLFPDDARRQAGFALSGAGYRMETLVMTIDTKIRHVTKPGANLFLELGFAPDEAERLHAASQKEINDTRLLKQQLMREISGWIDEHNLRQADAAEILMVSRPRVSDVVNQKTAKFTLDTLVEMLSRIGKPVTIAVG